MKYDFYLAGGPMLEETPSTRVLANTQRYYINSVAMFNKNLTIFFSHRVIYFILSHRAHRGHREILIKSGKKYLTAKALRNEGI
jgi:hypothetical protein